VRCRSSHKDLSITAKWSKPLSMKIVSKVWLQNLDSPTNCRRSPSANSSPRSKLWLREPRTWSKIWRISINRVLSNSNRHRKCLSTRISSRRVRASQRSKFLSGSKKENPKIPSDKGDHCLLWGRLFLFQSNWEQTPPLVVQLQWIKLGMQGGGIRRGRTYIPRSQWLPTMIQWNAKSTSPSVTTQLKRRQM
jgi:hypothetical protein